MSVSLSWMISNFIILPASVASDPFALQTYVLQNFYMLPLSHLDLHIIIIDTSTAIILSSF